jgi:hypothetical protein
MIILYIVHDTIGFYLSLNLHDILFLFIAAPGSPGNAHVLDIDVTFDDFGYPVLFRPFDFLLLIDLKKNWISNILTLNITG